MPLWQKRKNGRITSLWSVSWKSVNIMYNSVLEDSSIAITWHIVWHSNAIFFAWYSRTKHHKNSLASKTPGIDLLGMKRGESKRELKEIFTVDSSRFKESYTAASSLPKGGRITKHLASLLYTMEKPITRTTAAARTKTGTTMQPQQQQQQHNNNHQIFRRNKKSIEKQSYMGGVLWC